MGLVVVEGTEGVGEVGAGEAGAMIRMSRGFDEGGEGVGEFMMSLLLIVPIVRLTAPGSTRCNFLQLTFIPLVLYTVHRFEMRFVSSTIP